MAIPAFDQYVEYVTEGPVIHAVPLMVHALDSLATLEVLQAGYAHAASLGRILALAASEVAALQTSLGTIYHADVISNEVKGSDPAQIVANLLEVRSRPEWGPGLSVKVGEVYFFKGNLYTVIQAHKTQSDWTPDLTPALWRRFYEPEAGPQPWVQPTGAHDAYQRGDRVTYQGATWESAIDANVWAPGVFGWVKV